METDAKGQVGGLETSPATRRRLALESRTWKCASCGKSNQEILQSSSDAAAALEGESVAEEVVVPAELKMGFKEELAKGGGDGSDGESAELAEGFVRTVGDVLPVVGQGDGVVAPVQEPRHVPVQARPAQGVPRPTATTAGAAPVPAVLAAQRRGNTSDGVPGWVDTAILGLVACLVLMFLKIWFGF